MAFLSKIWVRVIISLLAGGMASEIIFLVSGDPTRHRSKDDPNFTLLYALIIFLILSAVVHKFGKKKFQ
jgi:hypothetical protein